MAILMYVRGFHTCAVLLPMMIAANGRLSWAYALILAAIWLLVWGGVEAIVWVATHRVTVARW